MTNLILSISFDLKELLKRLDQFAGNEFKMQQNVNKESDKQNKFEFYREQLRKRDEHIRDLEALDKADNIELQFFKDEVKSVFNFALF